MIIIAGSLSFDPSDRDDVLASLAEVTEASRRDAGCLEYFWGEDLEAPNTFRFFECWESQDAARRAPRRAARGRLRGAEPAAHHGRDGELLRGVPDGTEHAGCRLSATGSVSADERNAARRRAPGRAGRRRASAARAPHRAGRPRETRPATRGAGAARRRAGPGDRAHGGRAGRRPGPARGDRGRAPFAAARGPVLRRLPGVDLGPLPLHLGARRVRDGQRGVALRPGAGARAALPVPDRVAGAGGQRPRRPRPPARLPGRRAAAGGRDRGASWSSAPAGAT